VGNAEQSDDLTMLAIHYTRRQLNMIMRRQLVMNNDVQEIPRLSTFVDEVCEELGMDMGTTMQMNLALEEAVVNVMNYAYPKDFQGEVRVEAGANAVRLKFIITDDGKPFDPTARGEVDTTLSAEERNIGGLGIHLVRRIMDSINYERINGQNVLTLRKNFKKEES
jgi:sigma-B regulation protein RsbU (phosphoserine phosphatase)